MLIRPAKREDLPQLLEIYNHVILHTTAVYSYDPVSLEDRVQWFEARAQQGFPVFVAEDQAGIAGYSSYGAFRAWPAYLHSVENSVYVHPERRGQGVGKLLIPPLIEAARAQNMHTLIAGIDATNTASIRLHQHFDFTQVAHFRQVGYKFGRWLDLLFFQLMLGEASS